MKKSYIVRTLGCKANLYDSQLLESELQKRGWTPNPEGEAEGPALCIVNSCTVTDEADRQTRKMASRLFRENPNARVVVTGCGAEVDPERLASSQGVHYVIGNQDKPRLVELILEKLAEPRPLSHGEVLGAVSGYEELLSRHPMDREWPLPAATFEAPPVLLEGHSGKTRAFLKIQEGCNSFCTYCIIPYGRGPSRSLSPEEVVRQVRELVRRGVREIVITGTNIGDYGTDWGDAGALPGLLKAILEETELGRLRVSSLDPSEILMPGLLELAEKNPRFCPHFHVSLQSVDTRILRLMKRKYGFEQVKECLERIARLPSPVGGAFVGMDLITGFPGETEEDFARGMETLASLPWSRLHVFPFSEREGTPATRLPASVPVQTRRERARKLGRLSQERMRSIHERVVRECRENGRPLEGILLEKPVRIEGELRSSGYTPNYLRVILKGTSGDAGEGRNSLIQLIPKGIFEDQAAGEVALWASLEVD